MRRRSRRVPQAPPASAPETRSRLRPPRRGSPHATPQSCCRRFPKRGSRRSPWRLPWASWPHAYPGRSGRAASCARARTARARSTAPPAGEPSRRDERSWTGKTRRTTSCSRGTSRSRSSRSASTSSTTATETSASWEGRARARRATTSSPTSCRRMPTSSSPTPRGPFSVMSAGCSRTPDTTYAPSTRPTSLARCTTTRFTT